MDCGKSPSYPLNILTHCYARRIKPLLHDCFVLFQVNGTNRLCHVKHGKHVLENLRFCLRKKSTFLGVLYFEQFRFVDR